MASPSSSSSSASPVVPFSLATKIKLAYLHVCNVISHFWQSAAPSSERTNSSSDDHHDLIIQRALVPVPPPMTTTLTSFTRIRSYSMSWLPTLQTHSHNHSPYYWRSQPSEYYCLPVYLNDSYIETQSYNPKPNTASTTTPLGLGKTVVGLTFQTVGGLALAFQSFSAASSSTLPDRLTGQPNHDHYQQQRLQTQAHIVGVVMVYAFAGCFCGIVLRHAYPRVAFILEKIGYLFATFGFFLMTSIFLSGIFTWISWLACVFSLLALFMGRN